MTATASDRLRAMLADLKMPGALEAVDGVLAPVDSGAVTASEAIELVLTCIAGTSTTGCPGRLWWACRGPARPGRRRPGSNSSARTRRVVPPVRPCQWRRRARRTSAPVAAR